MSSCMKKFFLLSFLNFCFLCSHAQTYNITGKISDNSNQSLPGANILLLKSGDSTQLKGTTSDKNGFFNFDKISKGNYVVKIQFLGFSDIFKALTINNSSINLGKLIMEESAITLKGINISEAAIPVIQKDDTTEYDATAFKVNPDASTEDLVTKMPGVVVQDGKIQAQGTEVTKVLVDGKPFFGKDPNAALKNLPAEAVDRIQIYDSKSDQAQFTGFDDGDVSKAINIITKLPFRNGVFGRVYLGGGYEDKWRAGAIINLFKGSKRVTFMLNSNNVNEQNFSIDDIMGVMGSISGGGGGRRMMRTGGGGFGGRMQGGGSLSSFMMNPQSGINTTNSFGVNFLDQWGKVEFTGSYFFNYTKNETQSEIDRNYITPQTQGLTYNANNYSTSQNVNHRFNFKFDYKIDSMNSILFQPAITIQQFNASVAANENNLFNSLLISQALTDNTTDRSAINFSLPILYRHSFEKKGRTLSSNFTPGYNQTKGNYEQLYNTFSFDTTEMSQNIISSDTINQIINQNRKGYNLSGNVIYTEPLTDNFSLLASYYGNYNRNISDKETFDYNKITDVYDLIDTLLSNDFKSQYFSNSGGLSLRYSKEKWYVTAGASVQYSQISNKQIFPGEYDLKKPFTNYLPSAEFQYRFSRQKNLRINYRTSTREPSIDQLQEVVDNSNPSQLSIGNPDLDQTWQNNLSMRYSSANPEKSTNFFAMINATYTKDYIGKKSYIVKGVDTIRGFVIQQGSQLTIPINFDNYYSLRGFVNYGLPIKPIKSNFNFNISGNYSNTPTQINEVMNYSKNTSLGLGLVLSSNISEKFDFMIYSNSNINFVNNTIENTPNSRYFKQNARLRLNIMPFNWLVLQTELTDDYYSDFEGNENQNYLLWNAGIAFKLLKNRKLELKLSVYDILKQTQNLNRDITESYYEDVLTNTLSRYLMFSVLWNFTTFKNGNPNMDRSYRREIK